MEEVASTHLQLGLEEAPVAHAAAAQVGSAASSEAQAQQGEHDSLHGLPRGAESSVHKAPGGDPPFRGVWRSFNCQTMHDVG